MRWGMLLGLLLTIPWTAKEAAAPPAGQTANRDRPRCGSPGDDLQFARITEEWKQNYNVGNAAGVAVLYAPEAIYLTQHFVTGMVEGCRAIQAYVQRGVDAHYRVDSIEVLRAARSGDLGYVVDRYTSMNAGQKTMEVNLVVLRKLGGQWRIVAQEAAVPDPANAVQQLDIPEE
jgi:ketosteroid isomerase-like protein